VSFYLREFRDYWSEILVELNHVALDQLAFLELTRCCAFLLVRVLERCLRLKRSRNLDNRMSSLLRWSVKPVMRMPSCIEEFIESSRGASIPSPNGTPYGGLLLAHSWMIASTKLECALMKVKLPRSLKTLCKRL
jgi:hypothetical protein